MGPTIHTVLNYLVLIRVFFFFLYQHWDFFFADIEFESEEMVVEPNYVFTKLQFYYIFSYNLDLSYVISQVDLRKIPLLLLQ